MTALQAAETKTMAVESIEHTFNVLLPNLLPNDIVIFMGAGDITQWAYKFPELYKEAVSETN